MRLKIIELDFTNKFDWLFKLSNETGHTFYIMSEPFYKNNGLKSPVTKKELDHYDKEQWINASIREIDGKNVVISE
jgi:hypothetical protein